MPDSIWQVFGVILSLGALGVLGYAIGGDWIVQRFRRRRRCPKCWYDLSHTPGLTCSECGYTAARERQLFKSRRKWRLVWVAILPFLASHGLRVTPEVRQRGWPAAVPTTIKILVLPYLSPNSDALYVQLGPGNAQPPGAQQLRIRDRLYLDLYREVSDRPELPGWQERLIDRVAGLPSHLANGAVLEWPTPRDRLLAATRFANGDRANWRAHFNDERPAIHLATRSSWPREVDVMAIPEIGPIPAGSSMVIGLRRTDLVHGIVIEAAALNNALEWTDHAINLGPAVEGDLKLIASITERQSSITPAGFISRTLKYPDQEIQMSIAPADGVASIVQPVRSGGFDAALRSGLDDELIIEFDPLFPEHAWLEIRPDFDASPELAAFLDAAPFAVHATILVDETVIGERRFWFRLDSQRTRERNSPVLFPEAMLHRIPLQIPDDLSMEMILRGMWSLRLKGDAMVALRDPSATRFWDVDLEIPMRVVKE